MSSTNIEVETISFLSTKYSSVQKKGKRTMGEVKHIVLAKFKDGISQQNIDDIIKDYANLVNLIEPMKSLQWGTDVSIENLHQGFTHVFESTFETTEGLAHYVGHEAHVEFANHFLLHADKVIVIDYKPTKV